MNNDYEGHWDDAVPPDFEDFWLEIVEYADSAGLPVSYVEEEFLIDGELIKANINFKKQSL